MAATHKVKSGETLWAISKQHFGQGHLWPSIYIYNNLPDAVRQRGHRLINPNLIHPGDVIFLPPTGHSAPKPRISAPPAATSSARSMNGATVNRVPSLPLVPKARTGDNPASQVLVPDFPVRYVFPDQVLYTATIPGWKVSAKLVGSIMLQRTRKVSMVTFSNKGAEVSAKTDANFALSRLTSESKVSFDPSSNVVKFECSMTTRAGVDLPGTKVTFSVGPGGNAVGRASIVMPTLKGFIGDYAFASGDLRVDFEIESNDINRTPAAPSAQAVTRPVIAGSPSQTSKSQSPGSGGVPPSPPSSGGNHALPGGTWLMIGAAVVVGVMIVQDLATAGVGIADNAAALGLAATMWRAGMNARTERQRLEPGA